MRKALVFLGLVFGLVGCAAAEPTPTESCLEFRDAVVDNLANRCEMGSEKQIREMISYSALKGDTYSCDEVHTISDPSSFEEDCLANLEYFSCERLAAGRWPTGCIQQLQLDPRDEAEYGEFL